MLFAFGNYYEQCFYKYLCTSFYVDRCFYFLLGLKSLGHMGTLKTFLNSHPFISCLFTFSFMRERHVCATQYTQGGQSWFFPSTMWVLGVKLRAPALVTSDWDTLCHAANHWLRLHIYFCPHGAFYFLYYICKCHSSQEPWDVKPHLFPGKGTQNTLSKPDTWVSSLKQKQRCCALLGEKWFFFHVCVNVCAHMCVHVCAHVYPHVHVEGRDC